MPVPRNRSQPSRFGDCGPDVKAQQADIHNILRSTGAQAKLTIGQPNDKYEQEADRVADQVMAMPDPKLQRQPEGEEEEETLQTKPLADQITPLVQRQEEPPDEKEEQFLAKALNGIVQRQREAEEEEETLQAKAISGHTPTVGATTHAKILSLKGGGQPLTDSTLSFFDPRIGCDFNQIRIHTDAKAASTAKAMDARAFTLGQDIVFGAGQYLPHTPGGKHLLAHELTHVGQQKRAPIPYHLLPEPEEELEETVQPMPEPALQRMTEEPQEELEEEAVQRQEFPEPEEELEDTVQTMPDPALQRKSNCACGGSCPTCKANSENPPELLRKTSGNESASFSAPSIVSDVVRSPGRPLNTSTRFFMEPRFGRNFSQVRVHTDAKAAQSARAVNALA